MSGEVIGNRLSLRLVETRKLDGCRSPRSAITAFAMASMSGLVRPALEKFAMPKT
jgi:hypothetical protein